MAQVGRISGPLLFANLERNGVDLAFRNDLDTTQLLYLEVNNGLIGVNKSSPGYQIDTFGTTRTTNLIVDTNAEIADFNINTNNINNLTGDINLNAPSIINLSNLETDNIHISDNSISSYRTNSNIDLVPNGTGSVEVQSNLNVDGNLHATGNITFDGSVVFGDALAQDTIAFNSDVSSNIVPDQDNTYNLGSSSKRWLELSTNLVNGTSVSTSSLVSGLVDFNLRHGNIIYVAENGSDTNVGDSPLGPFKTIKHALDFADASTSGPVTIYISPGGYEEELPLVVPANVSVVGEDFRNTFIRPTSADQSKDIFHLNGESTVQNLTITDFYYDSVGDTGYAFRFAPNTVVTTRSPYIQNVTVITKGTTTSASDPRGFASGDAGKGALVDGASVNSASEEASMLFHSCTFITPGVDALTMTNGVRVEWLNSFTYFANRGLYAVDGVTGHLSTDGSTVKYGAELRSIGSANVYGNYGAVADGSDSLMYLIQHNMAYIGVGKYVDNDPSRVIQSQEVTELNSGRIYYQTVDHYGNFRVGDNFLVDQESGETSLVLTEAQIDSLNGMTITTGGNTTYIDGTRVETGNIRFRDNTVSSLIGNINIESASGTINLQNSTNMQKNLSITGDLSFDGALITVGNETTDTVTFNTDFTQDVIPDISGAYKLGSSTKTWKNIHLSKAEINDIEIQDNQIRSAVSNADLELRANGTGIVLIPSNNVVVSERLIASQDTTLNSASIVVVTNNGTSEVVGNHSLSDLDTETLNVDQLAQFEEILFDDNYITTTSTNADLELRANGTGEILVPNNNVSITNNLTTRDIDINTVNIQENITSVELFASENLNIRDNFIQTTQSNSNLELLANGTGKIVTSNAVQIDNNITINRNLTLSLDLTADDLLGVTNVSADQFYAERLHTDNQIEIWDNNIATVVSNSNLEFRANGTGGVYFEDIIFNENILSTGNNDSTDVDINLTPGGNISITSTKSLQLPIGTSIQRIGNLGDVRFNTDYGIFEGTGTSNIGFGGVYSDDRLTSVTVDHISNNIRMVVNGDDNPIDSTKLILEVTGEGVFTKQLEVDDINLNSNTIRTTLSNSDLDLQALGTGEISLDNVSLIGTTIKNNTLNQGILTISNTGFGKVRIDNTLGVVVPYGTTYQQPIYSDRLEVTAIISVGTTTVIEVSTAHGLTTGDQVYVSGVESSTDDNLENLNTDDSSSPGSHGVVSAPTTTRLELAVDTTGANIGNYVSGTGFLVGRLSTNPPVGDTRWNTDTVVLETWDGETYITSAGAFTAITQSEYEDLLLEYTLALG